MFAASFSNTAASWDRDAARQAHSAAVSGRLVVVSLKLSQLVLDVAVTGNLLRIQLDPSLP